MATAVLAVLFIYHHFLKPDDADRSKSSVDRIQQLRREYQQARREGSVPPYEEPDPRRRGHENEVHR
ncbi:hypothetical protein JOQ06_029839, partial [Pogonophryne albipinna]